MANVSIKVAHGDRLGLKIMESTLHTFNKPKSSKSDFIITKIVTN